MPETLAHLSARGDVPVIRSFMRLLPDPTIGSSRPALVISGDETALAA